MITKVWVFDILKNNGYGSIQTEGSTYEKSLGYRFICPITIVQHFLKNKFVCFLEHAWAKSCLYTYRQTYGLIHTEIPINPHTHYITLTLHVSSKPMMVFYVLTAKKLNMYNISKISFDSMNWKWLFLTLDGRAAVCYCSPFTENYKQ